MKERERCMEHIMKEEDEKYEYWLASLHTISHIKKRKLRESTNLAKEIYQIEALCKNPFVRLTDLEIEYIKSSVRSWDLEREWERAQEKSVKFVTFDNPMYPKRLQPYKDAPYALFYKGALPDESRKTAAIVGARKCSPYGEKYATEYSQLLTRCGVQVISGLAKGIDGIAQRAAIEEGGCSYGILGSGLDKCYPREHIGLYQDLLINGGVLSEQPLGIEPLARNFPLRNRIISGLSDVILVIEAKERSGSLITADLGLEQGKEVYALPGMVNSALSKGCNELIKQGAGLLNSPEELMEELEISIQNKSRKLVENKKILESKEKLVYSCLCAEEKHVDKIRSEVCLPVHEVISALVSLELKGYIREISKNYYAQL